MRPEVGVMAKQPELLKEALDALRDVAGLKIDIEKVDDPQGYRILRQVDRVLAKAAGQPN
jgi:hypothetical protein